jgi:hypothetical protein
MAAAVQAVVAPTVAGLLDRREPARRRPPGLKELQRAGGSFGAGVDAVATFEFSPVKSHSVGIVGVATTNKDLAPSQYYSVCRCPPEA